MNENKEEEKSPIMNKEENNEEDTTKKDITEELKKENEESNKKEEPNSGPSINLVIDTSTEENTSNIPKQNVDELIEDTLEVDETRLKGISSADLQGSAIPSPQIADSKSFDAELNSKLSNEDINQYGVDVLKEIVERRLKSLRGDNLKMRHYLRIAYRLDAPIDDSDSSIPNLSESLSADDKMSIHTALDENSTVQHDITALFDEIHQQDESNYTKQHDLISLESDYQELKDMRNEEAYACHQHRKDLLQLQHECKQWESFGRQILNGFSMLQNQRKKEETPRQTPLKRRVTFSEPE